MEKNLSGVYAIINKVNGKKYIGSSKNISYRYNHHLSRLINNKHNNTHLQNAVNKYGIINFSFEIIELIDNNQLLFKEQYYINKTKWDMLYNKTKIAGSGGGDVRRKKIYILDLEGNIIKKLPSGIETANYLGYKTINYNNINTKSIKNKLYRLVTPEFYNNNFDEIQSWRLFSSEVEYRKKEFKKKKFIVYNDNKVYYFNTYRGISKKLNITHQRVQQIYILIDKSIDKKYFHKKSGFYLAYIEKKD